MCPGAPFLIEGTAEHMAVRLKAVVDACSVAVSRLSDSDAVLLVTSGATGSTDDGPDSPAWRELPPGTVISTTPVRRSDLPEYPARSLASGGEGAAPVSAPAVATPSVATPSVATPSVATLSVTTLSVGTMVGAALLAAQDAGASVRGNSPARRPPTTAFEITGQPAAVAEMLAQRVHSAQRIALLVIADGSACHGDDAPGRRDDRARTFDARLADALAAGDPDALRVAAADPDLARALLAAVDPLTVLALLAAGRPPATAELLYSDAPLGVGYLVASWRWAQG